MKKITLKIAGLLLATAATVLTTRADVALTENISAYGYAAGFLEYRQHGGGNDGLSSTTDIGLRAAKLGVALSAAPVTAKVSVYDDGSKLYLLEANGTYDMDGGMTVTAGRYLSRFGYEPFDIPNGNFITNGNESLVLPNLLPNFHEGVRIDYAVGKSTFSMGAADSLYNGAHKFSGDGTLSDGYSMEFHYGYNDGALSVGATFGYQNTHGDNAVGYPHDIYIGDLWAQYIVKKTTVGAEAVWKHSENNGPKTNAYYGLVSLKQQVSEPLAVALRFSTGRLSVNGNTGFWKLSLAPTYALTQNLGVTAEIHYAKYNGDLSNLPGNKNKNIYGGLQACFKF